MKTRSMTKSLGGPLGLLPIEVLRITTSSLSSKDLKNLRLMSRKLNRVTSETLFRAITLSTSPESIIQLLSIASSEFRASQVRYVNWVLVQCYGDHSTDPGTPVIKMKYPSFFNGLTGVLTSHLNQRSSKGYTIYHLLDLQCHLLATLPNLQTVRFQCANEDQRRTKAVSRRWKDIIKWVRFVLRRGAHAIYLVDKIIRYETMDPFGLDLFGLLKWSGIKPSRMETPMVTNKLTYTDDGKIDAVDIVSRYMDPGRQGEQIH